MLHLLSNPGIFHQPKAHEGIVSIIGFIGLAVLIATIIFVVYRLHKGSSSRKQVIYAILGYVITLGIFVSVIAYDSIVREEAKTKYYSSVVTWLATDYGMKATPEDARGLVKGQTFAATYHAKTISFSILKDLNGNLAVVDDKKTVLQPNN